LAYVIVRNKSQLRHTQTDLARLDEASSLQHSTTGEIK
jgi:hypothetical protein